jgi:hypothetical protein
VADRSGRDARVHGHRVETSVIVLVGRLDQRDQLLRADSLVLSSRAAVAEDDFFGHQDVDDVAVIIGIVPVKVWTSASSRS